MLEASGIYSRWKVGIDGAGRQMQEKIGEVALTLVFLALDAYLATPAVPASVKAVQKAASCVSKADAAFVRVAAEASGEITSPAVIEYEQALEEFATATEEMFEMIE